MRHQVHKSNLVSVYGGSEIIAPKSPISINSPAWIKHVNTQVSEYADSLAAYAQQTSVTPDVIHAHDWLTFPAAVRLKKALRKAFVAHIHSTEFDRSPHGGNQYIHELEYQGLEAADMIIAVSQFTKQVLIDKYQVAANKIQVVHNAVEDTSLIVAESAFAIKRPMVVFLGRLTLQKGPEFFIEFADKLLQRIPQALFVIAGNGDMYQSLLFQTAKQHLTASVLFTDFIRDQEKELLLKRADVFVMPSVAEPFGLVALEAARYEKPVILSETSGVKEVLPHSPSFQFWDTDRVTAEAVKLITEKTYRQTVVNGQNQDLQNISWNFSAQKVKALYSDLTS